MSEDNQVAGIGHNLPPNDSVLLQEALQEKTFALRSRHDELLAAVERIPAECADDETAGKIGDMIKMITACHKSFETQRVGEKEPYLTLGRTVDGFYKKFTEGLEGAKKRATKPLDAYLQKKAEEKRAAEREAARLQRIEADRLAREAEELAQANMTQASDATLKEAVKMDEQATKSDKLADARPAELARTRGDYGSLATLRTTWVGEIVEKSAVDLEALRPFISEDVLQKLINAAVRAGFRELRGVKIYEKSEAQVR